MRHPMLTRRNLLLGGGLGVAGGAALGGAWLAKTAMNRPAGPFRVMASSSAVRRTEELRYGNGTGRTVRATLTADPAEVDLGGRVVSTWAYNGQAPGPILRCTAGDQLQVTLRNGLQEDTTIHWHGLRLRNDMDGVPHLTQDPVAPSALMRYTFVAPDPGTYWFHPHVGLQRERGLIAPLIIDDPNEAGEYDSEFIVVLNDWLDGVSQGAEAMLASLQELGAEGLYAIPVQAGQIADQSGSWRYDETHLVDGSRPCDPEVLSSSRSRPCLTQASQTARSEESVISLAGSVSYPFYLLNGRLPTAPQTFNAKPGQRVRIRVINASGATVFRLALGGHRLTVTHSDGFPVRPVEVDNVLISSGERYDMTVTLDDGVFPLVAVAEGRLAQAMGVVRTGGGAVPPPDVAPRELAGRVLALTDMEATPPVRLSAREPDVIHRVYLTGDMEEFAWRINAEAYNPHAPFDGITPLEVRYGQRVRLALINQTPMYHPVHLHGHSFAIRSIAANYGNGPPITNIKNGAIKDNLLVPPGQRIDVDFTADNPGQWLIHCHNAYHLPTGMATILSYVDAP